MVDDTDGKAKRALELTQEREHGARPPTTRSHRSGASARTDPAPRGAVGRARSWPATSAILHQVQPPPRGGDGPSRRRKRGMCSARFDRIGSPGQIHISERDRVRTIVVLTTD